MSLYGILHIPTGRLVYISFLETASACCVDSLFETDMRNFFCGMDQYSDLFPGRLYGFYIDKTNDLDYSAILALLATPNKKLLARLLFRIRFREQIALDIQEYRCSQTIPSIHEFEVIELSNSPDIEPIEEVYMRT